MLKIDDEIKLLIEKLENIHLESDDLSSLLSFLNDLVENYNLAHTRAEDHISPGTITWQVGSLHLYQSQFYLIKAYAELGRADITLSEWKKHCQNFND